MIKNIYNIQTCNYNTGPGCCLIGERKAGGFFVCCSGKFQQGRGTQKETVRVSGFLPDTSPDRILLFFVPGSPIARV